MNLYVNNIEFNTDIFPNIHISSANLKENRGLFLVNPALHFNLINEKKLSPNTIINRSESIVLDSGSFVTSGTAEIIIANKSIKFRTYINNRQNELTDILGLPFLNTDPREFTF